MRIIAGDWRGRPLQAPAGQGTRPTSDRTRETLFSMLVSRLGSFEGLRVADLYAGSGGSDWRPCRAALLLPRSSRRTRARSPPSAPTWQHSRPPTAPKCFLYRRQSLRHSQPFHVVFADPPYTPGSGTAVVATVREAGWLAPGGWLAIESEAPRCGRCRRLAGRGGALRRARPPDPDPGLSAQLLLRRLLDLVDFAHQPLADGSRGGGAGGLQRFLRALLAFAGAGLDVVIGDGGDRGDRPDRRAVRRPGDARARVTGCRKRRHWPCRRRRSSSSWWSPWRGSPRPPFSSSSAPLSAFRSWPLELPFFANR